MIDEIEEGINDDIEYTFDFLIEYLQKNFSIDKSVNINKHLYHWAIDDKIEIGNFYKDFSFEDVIQKSIEQNSSLESQIKNKKTENYKWSLNFMVEELNRHKYDLQKCRGYSFKKLFSLISQSYIDQYFEVDGYSDVKNDHNLIRFLLIIGYIDENYWRYIGYFHEGHLTFNDNKFLEYVKSGRKIKPNYKINNPKIVMGYLNNDDYKRKYCANYDLLDEIIATKNFFILIIMLETALDGNNQEFLEYLDTLNYDRLTEIMSILADKNFYFFFKLFSNKNMPETLKLKMSGLMAILNKGNYFDNRFIEYLNKNNALLKSDFFPDKNLL